MSKRIFEGGEERRARVRTRGIVDGDFGKRLEGEMRGEAGDIGRLGKRFMGVLLKARGFRRDEEFGGSDGER